MTLAIGSQLHFQCSFEVRPNAECVDPWSALAKTIRSWLEQSPRHHPPPTNPAFHGSWFFVGGEWKAPGSAYHFIKSSRLLGDGNDREPQHWAFCYEHACEEPGRMWRVDAGITRTRGAYRVSIRTSHYLRPGFIGREPPAPLPTAPGVVGRLLRAPWWECYAGSERLRSTVNMLKLGEGEAFRATLEDARRECPIVLVAKHFHTGQACLDTAKLARLLAGAASVYESESSALDKEVEWCLGRRFSCWNGMVRVYQPGLDFRNREHSKRQRYLSADQIAQQGPDATVEMLVRGIARRSHQNPPGVTASLDDVAIFDRERRLDDLKAKAGGATQEWVKLLEDSNAELEKAGQNMDDELQRLRSDSADAADQIARLEFEKKSALARAHDAERTAKALQGKLAAVESLKALPETVPAVCDLIRQLHPGRIDFTEAAMKSARDATVDIGDAWRCLFAMATTLHDIFFAGDEKRGDIEKRFRENTGIRLAMTEGEMTKDDGKLKRQRKDTYAGTEIDITPHVKFDKGTTRAYFCPFRKGDTQLIVVGYIGHLDTAGTRRRK